MMQYIPKRQPSNFIMVLIYCFSLQVLVSCEPGDEKTSRLTLDTYSLKLNSVFASIVESRVDEGIPGISPDGLYSTIISKVNEIDAGLADSRFAPGYLPFCESQRQVVREVGLYLENRVQSVLSMNDVLSCYQSATAIRAEMEDYKNAATSSYGGNNFNTEAAAGKLDELNARLAEFIDYKDSWSQKIGGMDSASLRLESIISGYNLKAEGSRLRERIVLPPAFRDTINDLLLSNRAYILNLQVKAAD